MSKKPILAALIIAGFIIAIATGLRYAEANGVLQEETVRRSMQILFGIMLAAYANVMPKQISSLRGSPEAYRCSQATLRFGGWCLAVAGLTYAAFWALAPVTIAKFGATTVVAVALALTVGHVLRSLAVCRRSARTQSAS